MTVTTKRIAELREKLERWGDGFKPREMALTSADIAALLSILDDYAALKAEVERLKKANEDWANTSVDPVRTARLQLRLEEEKQNYQWAEDRYKKAEAELAAARPLLEWADSNDRVGLTGYGRLPAEMTEIEAPYKAALAYRAAKEAKEKP